MSERRLPAEQATSEPDFAVASSRLDKADWTCGKHYLQNNFGLLLIDQAKVDLGLMNLPNLRIAVPTY